MALKIKLRHLYITFIIVAFGIIIAQLFSHQILNGPVYEESARRNYVRIIRINANRGMILDERLRPIVVNRPAISLYFRPYLIQDRAAFIEYVTSHIDVTAEYLQKLIYDNRFRSFDEILIASNLSEEVLAKVAEGMNYFTELLLKPESMRHYNIPNHFTGYVGKISEQEFRQFRGEDYTLNSIIGKNGIERFYEGLLAGRSGYEIVQVDSRGRSLNLFKHDLNKKPINGFNVVLTINVELQEYIRTIFPNDKAGAVVVMNPKTGGILSYNSFPEYDQNWFAEGISTAQWEFLRDHEIKPLIDRVSTGTYPPGSTFKAITGSFGVEKNYVTEHTRLANCAGGMQIGDRFFKCWLARGHGRSDFYDAMSVSCDVYYYDLSARFNLDEFSDFVHRNHIVGRTGVDLPTERGGFFPTSQWYRNRLGGNFSTLGSRANLSIGQGEVLVSPLAMCAYYAAIANDGEWRTPHLFLRAFNDITSIDDQFINMTVERLPISEKTLQMVQQALHDTVYRDSGTGRNARVPGAEVYGKTGSSENPHGELTHASYAGYAKWNGEAEIAFYIIVENAGSGGGVAGPIARRIIEYYQDRIR